MTEGKLYNTYETRLGKAMFPGADFFSQELQSYFSEMLIGHSEKGLPISALDLGASLEEFVPLKIRESSPAWIEQQTNRWLNELRPKIYAAIESFLINGGFEDRLNQQKLLIDDLETSGVELQGKSLLENNLALAGDWHESFIYHARQGRPLGVRFLQRKDYSDNKALIALKGAGFGEEQSRSILANIVSLDEISSKPKTDLMNFMDEWGDYSRINGNELNKLRDMASIKNPKKK